MRRVELFADRIAISSAIDLTEQSLDDLERLTGSVQRMRTSIEGLLTYSRVSTGSRQFEPVDLGTIAREVVAGLDRPIEAIGCEVHLGHLPVIEADPSQMSQLLTNLISNVLKFHRLGVPRQITVKSKMIDGDYFDGPQICEIAVQDNGIGFDEMYLDQIFSMFQRLHGRNEYPGTGIGLAICRRVVERHGVKITAISTPGEGSTFTIWLPVIHDAQRDTHLPVPGCVHSETEQLGQDAHLGSDFFYSETLQTDRIRVDLGRS